MRGSEERKIENRPEYIFITLHRFSSYNPVISGVWEKCKTASINIWLSGLHHRPCSIGRSSDSARVPTVQSVAGLSFPQWPPLHCFRVPAHSHNFNGHSFSFCSLVSLRSGSMCCDWTRAAPTSVHWVLSATRW